MKYVFFDIECANCNNGQGKICSFGYVVTDSEFNVLERRDIIMNPKAEFILAGRNKTPDIVLAYTKQQFKKAPTFDFYYDEIRDLLCGEDRIVVGHSISNDIGFLLAECRRYEKPEGFSFTFCDTQRIFSFIHEVKQQVSLVDLVDRYGEKPDRDVHKSDDDAYMTMLGLKGMMEEVGEKLPDFLETNLRCKGYLKGFDVAYGDTTSAGGLSLRVWRARMYRLTRSIKKGAKSHDLKGMVFCFSNAIEKKNYQHTLYIIRHVIENGGYFDKKLEHLGLYVCDGDDTAERTEKLKKLIEEGQNATIIEPKEFLSRLGLPNGWREQANKEDYKHLD